MVDGTETKLVKKRSSKTLAELISGAKQNCMTRAARYRMTSYGVEQLGGGSKYWSRGVLRSSLLDVGFGRYLSSISGAGSRFEFGAGSRPASLGLARLVAAVSDIENEGSVHTAGTDSHPPDDQCDHAFAGGASSTAPNITVTPSEECAVG